MVTLLGDSVPLSEVYDTGEWEVVYNLRVADHRTYFVGDDTWSFAVWAHNAGWLGCGIAGEQLNEQQLINILRQPGRHNVTVATKTEALELARKALPDAVQLPEVIAGGMYPSTQGIKCWFRIEPAEPAVGNNLPHVKFADWTHGKKWEGGRWGHIFFISSS